MSEEHSQEEPKKSSGEAWEEVGKQFQTLGESLAAAFRSSFNDDTTRQHFKSMQNGLEGLVDEVGKVIKENKELPEVQQFKQDAKKVADQLVEKGEKTVQEVRPHLLDALKSVNAELQKLAQRMENNPKGTDEQKLE